MLRARQLGFIHPKSAKRLEFTSPLPADFRKLGIALTAPLPDWRRPCGQSAFLVCSRRGEASAVFE